MKLVTPLVLALAASPAFAQFPCFASTVGTQLALGDDTFSSPLALGFTFTYGGQPYTDVQVCSNGFITMGSGSTGPADFTPTVAELLGNAEARICPLWADLEPNAGGTIWYSAVPAAGSTPAHFIVTFDAVLFWGTQNPATFQIIFIDGNSLQFHYDQNVTAGAAAWVTGASVGNNAAANPVTFGSLPIITNGNATLHEDGVGGFAVSESTIQWQTDGTGGYIVLDTPGCASRSAYGEGCYDAPRMVHEQILANTTPIDLQNTQWDMFYTPSGSGGNYLIIPGATPYNVANISAGAIDLASQTFTSSSSASWDDASIIVTLSTTTFPNGFPHPAAGGGNVTDITVNSNGKIYLGATTDGTFATNGSNYGNIGPFAGTTGAGLPTIAAFNTDMDPTVGGNIWFEDPSPNGGARITWQDVPNWPAVPGVDCDVQLELFPSGQVTLAFGPNLANDGNVNDAIIGYSAGGGEAVGGAIDWDMITSYQTGDGQFAPILSLDAAPVFGTSFDVVVDNLGPGTSTPFGGLLSIGFAAAPPGGIALTSLGVPMPGCNLYLDPAQILTNVLLANPSGTDMRWTWTLPTSGQPFSAFLQAATFTPTTQNSVGILATNAIQANLGL